MYFLRKCGDPCSRSLKKVSHTLRHARPVFKREFSPAKMSDTRIPLMTTEVDVRKLS
jgi:hypothetical protein